VECEINATTWEDARDNDKKYRKTQVEKVGGCA
jgi:hypothetical protein